MGPIGCPERTVGHYHNSLRNNPEGRTSQLLRGGSLTSRMVQEDSRRSTSAKLGFVSSPVRVVFVVNKMGLRQITVRVFRVDCGCNVLTMLQTHFYVDHRHNTILEIGEVL